MSSDGSPNAALIETARDWANRDPDPQTRAQVLAAVEDGDLDGLRAWFGPRLRFGTAGLRGPMQPGPAGINVLVGSQTAMGLADHLLAARQGGPVVIGYDGRHKSAEIAREMADVFARASFEVRMVDHPAPTPLVAWWALELGACAGVVVTASHNPPRDNGIKVYGGDGAQIIPPADAEIADLIIRAAAQTADRAAPIGVETRPPGAVIAADPSSIEAAYVEWVDRQVRPRRVSEPQAGRRSLRVAYTAMHGVGYPLASRCLSELVGAEVCAVREQRDPDPDFPTVSFPNPEEPGALDLALALAEVVHADLVIANDPDADRCAVAVPAANGSGWVQLTGDQVGWLLAERELRRGVDDRDLYVTTVVSSQLLAKMAADRGARFEETLTGFKWLCRPAMNHPELVQRLAYEEALGYAVGQARDKDGISAAVAIADFIADLDAEGETVWSVLEGLYGRYGHHRTRQVAIRSADRPSVPFGEGAEPPTEFGGLRVERVDFPAADVVRLFLDGGSRAAFRPSGTEPKFKVYLEAVVPHGGAAESVAERQLDDLEQAARTVLG
jgi:phosphomannomutase